MNLLLSLPAATITASLEDRVLSGVIVPYGEVGATSAGAVEVDPGALRIPEVPGRVKLFREHGRVVPLGPATILEDTPTALVGSFRVGATPDGDTALLEAAEGVRDGFSAEIANARIRNGHLVAGDVVAVAQVAVPAFASALIAAADTPTDEIDATCVARGYALGVDGTPIPEGDETDAVCSTRGYVVPAAAATETDPPAEGGSQPEEPTMTETVTATVEGSRPAGMLPVPAPRNPASDLMTFAAAAAEILTAAPNAETVNAALSDIVPPATGADPFMPPAYIGELWTPVRDSRPLVNVFGTTPLTSMTWQGWKWNPRPEVAPYAGSKAAVPSNAAKPVPAEGAAERIAGGWDVDRIYEDFNTGFIAALLSAAVADYGVKSEAALMADVLAAATAVAGPAANPTEALVNLAIALSAVGARMDFVGMAGDVAGVFLGMTQAEVPWWLQAQGSVNLAGPQVSTAGITIFTDPAITAGTIVAGDSRAVDYRETGPFRVQAVNIPNGGIDVGVFGYQGDIVQDAAGLAKTTVTMPVGTAAATSSKSK